jgi:hypothetical protein
MTHRKMGRYRYKEMHMIVGNMALHDFNVLCLANLPNQIPCSHCNVAPKDWLAVFGYPNDVVLDIIDGMARSPYRKHTKVFA